MTDHPVKTETHSKKEASQQNESLSTSNPRKKSRKSTGKDNKADNFDSPVFSVRYKDPSIELSEDRLTAVGYKGWSTVLLTHGASSGTWYFEIKVLEPKVISKFLGHSKFLNLKQDPSIRVGWSCRYNRLDIPVGTSSFGYSFNTKTYSIFSNSRDQKIPEAEKNTQISPGDVIGCLIRLSGLPYELEDPRNCPHLHPYLELGLLCNPEVLPKVISDPNSLIEFYVNGKKLSASFTNIASGFYHPTVSLYMGSSVKINTGPNFAFFPHTELEPAVRLLRPQIP
ncbi:SPRY domain-containing [Cryptosporidium sp. chipmunk genotype I]|uniref:SPRY domain-containing n=1 Tax=Cryptosporidium sp. chipmunk genotype I TaxID=1280935 RepID=UPI00351A22BE|nr:SPRY domain-containing [Cryptosporidium sp. chipmunk genotype I]